MNYSTCLMALVASRAIELQTEVNELLQSHLQHLGQFVTSFFGGRHLARRGLGL
jgi:hypothetical protein